MRTHAKRILPTVWILFSIGILISSWAASGVIGLLVLRGLDLISPSYFLLSAALGTAVVSYATGTSWGTLSTFGVALIGVSQGLGIHPGAAAGAIVSGSAFGDKLSPLSETAALASSVAGTKLYTHLRHSLYTTVPAFVISLLFYFLLGLGSDTAAGAGSQSELYRQIDQSFTWHWSLWGPVLIVLVAAVFHWPVVPSLLGSAALALLLAVMVQGYPAGQIPLLLWDGYQATTGYKAVNALFGNGGIWAMGKIAVLALGLFAAMILLLGSQLGQKLLDLIGKHTGTRFRTVAGAVLLSLTIVLTGTVTYVAIMVTGELMRRQFNKRGLAPENLSRTLEDAGTSIGPLIPWGVSGLFVHNTLGVSAWEYAPYAVTSYLGAALAVLYGYTGWFITKKEQAEGAES